MPPSSSKAEAPDATEPVAADDGALPTLERYTVLHRLAVGGMAQIFVAQRNGSNDICIIKQLRDHLTQDPVVANRFLREAQVAALLAHPNIARLTDAGREGGLLYLAMEFIAGKDIEAMMLRLLAQRKILPPALSITATLKVLEGLHYAHEYRGPTGEHLQIVHRDMSPRNVMITYDGEVKVIDFGLARTNLGDFRTAPGMVLGTLRYMSPEQAYADPVDRRSDIYTWAVVLYEMLSGHQLVIANSSAPDVLRAVITEVPEPLSHWNPNLPKALDEVLAKGMAKDRKSRFQTARDFQLALASAAGPLGDATDKQIGDFVIGLFPDEHRTTLEMLASAKNGEHIAFEQTKYQEREEITRAQTFVAARTAQDPITVAVLPEDPTRYASSPSTRSNQGSGRGSGYGPPIRPSTNGATGFSASWGPPDGATRVKHTSAASLLAGGGSRRRWTLYAALVALLLLLLGVVKYLSSPQAPMDTAEAPRPAIAQAHAEQLVAAPRVVGSEVQPTAPIEPAEPRSPPASSSRRPAGAASKKAVQASRERALSAQSVAAEGAEHDSAPANREAEPPAAGRRHPEIVALINKGEKQLGENAQTMPPAIDQAESKIRDAVAKLPTEPVNRRGPVEACLRTIAMSDMHAYIKKLRECLDKLEAAGR